MSKFKVGDKVEIKIGLKEGQRGNKANVTRVMARMCGKSATVVRIDNEGDIILDINPLYAWDTDWINHRREFIVIRRSGAETIAELRHDREVIKSAKATCAPSDTFDFDTGAKLAFDRLMGQQNIDEAVKAWNKPSHAPEPPKFYTGKVVCYGCEAGTEWVYGALIGKIGTIQNGHATWRSGLGCEGYTSFDDFCARNKCGRWLEIKE